MFLRIKNLQFGEKYFYFWHIECLKYWHMSNSDSKFINEILNFKILIYKKGLLTKFQLIFNLQIDNFLLKNGIVVNLAHHVKV